MAQLWGGRFTKPTDQLVYDFNASIKFDKRLLKQDIEGSIAHVVMLEKQDILSCEEKDAIVKGLTGIRKDVEDGKLEITSEYEDVHSFVEANLIDRIGDAQGWFFVKKSPILRNLLMFLIKMSHKNVNFMFFVGLFDFLLLSLYGI